MNSEHINAQHQTKRGKETFLSFYLPVACNKHCANWIFWWRAFPNACLLYQSIIGTRCEACAIKSLENKRIVACNLLHEIMNHALRWNFPVACNLLHEIMNHAPRWNFPVACNLLHEIMNTRKVVNNVPCVIRSCIKMHATIWNNPFWWRAFPNACLLYQSVIGTRYEACAIKSEIKSPIIDYRAFLRDILMNSVCRTIIISLSRGNLESECKA